MGNKIVIPKYRVELNQEPIIFLVGPITCGGGWQNQAIKFLRQLNYTSFIAAPDYAHVLEGSILRDHEISDIKFDAQLEWEQYYLEQAEKKGVILHWLARQNREMPLDEKTGFTKPYARDTRPETGAWGWGLLRFRPEAHVAVGGEKGYSGLSVCVRNFAKYAPHIPFRGTLEQTCKDALAFLKP